MLTEGCKVQVKEGGTFVPVEELRVGDTVFDPVSQIHCRLTNILSREVQFPANETRFEAPLFPVCLRAGSIAPNAPQRDILVSPKQALSFKTSPWSHDKWNGLGFATADQLPDKFASPIQNDLRSIRYFALFAKRFQFANVEGIYLQIFGDDLYAEPSHPVVDDANALFATSQAV
ncbi:Hint domain-containing protein [Aliiroseovarius crassostreae]|uniref:Hint domain-containing protein n=1 Tax=Aliiroseovarius crassostreae TaxID=154981 RepID=UPI003C7D5403